LPWRYTIAAAGEREALGRVIAHRDGEANLAFEPRLDRVLIARDHVHGVIELQ